jgi:hypothetical protein
MPDVIGRLIVEHLPDEHARCRGCTSPGTGRPNVLWPCSLRMLIDEAGRLRAARPMPEADEVNRSSTLAGGAGLSRRRGNCLFNVGLGGHAKGIVDS